MMAVVSTQDRSLEAVDVESLYRTHGSELVRLATLATGDRDQAEEVVQDLFARWWVRPPTIDSPERTAAFLRVSVLNACRSGFRRGAARERAHLRLVTSDERAPALAAETTAVRRESERAVLRAVRTLPRSQRDCVLLRYWMDVTEAATAETLGISVGTVKSNCHRAMKRLAPLLEGLR